MLPCHEPGGVLMRKVDEVEEDRHREGKGEVPDEVALALVLEAGNMVPGGLTHLVFHCAPAGRREPWIEQGAKTGVERRIEFYRDHRPAKSEEHTSELQSLMRNSYAVFCLPQQTLSEQCPTYIDRAARSIVNIYALTRPTTSYVPDL